MKQSTFDKVIDHVWSNRKTYESNDSEFDFPDYGGLPTEIGDSLSSEAVDAMQYCWVKLRSNSKSKADKPFSNKNSFSKYYRLQLFYLGEGVKPDIKTKAKAKADIEKVLYAVFVWEIGTGRENIGIFEKPKIKEYVIKTITKTFSDNDYFKAKSIDVNKITLNSLKKKIFDDYAIDVKKVVANKELVISI